MAKHLLFAKPVSVDQSVKWKFIVEEDKLQEAMGSVRQAGHYFKNSDYFTISSVQGRSMIEFNGKLKAGVESLNFAKTKLEALSIKGANPQQFAHKLLALRLNNLYRELCTRSGAI